MTNNLKNTEATQFRSGYEAVENGKKGGQASGKTRALKSIANKYGELKAPAKVIAHLIDNDMVEAGYEVSFDEAMIMAQYMKTFKGDTRAARYISEIKGEMIQKVAVSNIDQSLEEMNEYFGRQESANDTLTTE